MRTEIAISFYVLCMVYLTVNTENLLAQDKTMFLMNFQPDNNLVNPAFHDNNSFFVLSFGGYASFDNSSLTVNNLLTKRTENGNSNIYWDFETIDKKLLDENYVNLSAGTTPLFLGLNLKKSWSFNFSISIKNNGYIKYPESISLIRFGNADLDNDEPRTIDLNNYGLNELSFTEYSFGLAKELRPNFNIGVHVKLLSGISAIQTNRFLASIETSDDFSQALLKTNIVMDVSGPLFEADNVSNVFRQQLGFWEFIRGKESTSFKNTGTAFDFGFKWKLNDKWGIHASIIDLGAINWRERPQRLISKGEYLYNGVQFTPYNLTDDDFTFNDYLKQYADTVLSTVIPEAREESFKSQLYTKTYLGITYQYSEKLSFNGLYNTIIYKDITLRKGTFGTTYKLNEIISLTASLSYSNRWLNNVGLGAVVVTKNMQFYLVTDNANAVFLRNTRAINLAFGINYWFKRKKTLEE